MKYIIASGDIEWTEVIFNWYESLAMGVRDAKSTCKPYRRDPGQHMESFKACLKVRMHVGRPIGSCTR